MADTPFRSPDSKPDSQPTAESGAEPGAEPIVEHRASLKTGAPSSEAPPSPAWKFSDFFLSHASISPTLRMNERVNELWAQGETVYHLGFGESRFPAHPKIVQALRDNAHQSSYLSAQGLPALRHAVAGFYRRHLGLPIAADQIMVGPGSKSLIYALQMALDAHLILPTPSWVSYAPQARLLGRPVHTIPATPADGYAWGVAELSTVVDAIGDATKVLLINSPNNPTGQMFSASFLEELADCCRRRGILVLSDEIYALVPHGHQPHVSIAQYYPEGTVVLGGLSKQLSLGGWRLGVAVLPAHEAGVKLMNALRIIASEIWSTPTAPVQYAGVVAYGDDAEIRAYIEACARIHAVRTQHLWSWLMEMGIACAQPAGGFYMFPNFDRWRDGLAARNVHTSEDLAAYLLETYQIATLPGTAFGAPPRDLSLRLATSYVDMETDAQAQALLAAYRANPEPPSLLEEHHPHLHTTIEQLQGFVSGL